MAGGELGGEEEEGDEAEEEQQKEEEEEEEEGEEEEGMSGGAHLEQSASAAEGTEQGAEDDNTSAAAAIHSLIIKVWDCPQCTFSNRRTARKCEVCNLKRSPLVVLKDVEAKRTPSTRSHRDVGVKGAAGGSSGGEGGTVGGGKSLPSKRGRQ